jgi:aminoglycoside 3-N-acetyltransferase
MGAIAEAFRTYPGTLRSDHPLVSLSANGRHARAIVASHPLDFGEGLGSPLNRLYDLDGRTLLLGVGFDRCSALHFAESLVPARRTTAYRVPVERAGARAWVETRQMASDRGRLFPEIGARFEATGAVARGRIGGAEARLFPTRALVDFARPAFAALLA